MSYTLGYRISWRLKFVSETILSMNSLTRRGLITGYEAFSLFVPHLLRKLKPHRPFSKISEKRWSSYSLRRLEEFPEEMLVKYKIEDISLFVPTSFEDVDVLKFNYDEIFVRRIYESKHVKVAPGDVVVDAGACEGLFSLFALNKGCAEVIAFEPNNSMALALEKTFILNGFKEKAIVYKVGLSNKVDVSTFVTSVSMPGCSTFLDTGISDNWDPTMKKNICQVQVTTLDSFYESGALKRVDFIKADIEGYERKMLLGAEKVIRKFKPKLAICHYHLLDDFQTLVEIIRSFNPKYKLYANEDVLFAWDDRKQV